MSKLIDQLKSEHASLIALLVNVRKNGGNSKDSISQLLKAKSALQAHLNKEDEELYPTLIKAGENKEDVKAKLSHFGKDMDDITAFVFSFFENLENDTYSQSEFKRDFEKFVSVLLKRISREEHILYPLYEKYR